MVYVDNCTPRELERYATRCAREAHARAEALLQKIADNQADKVPCTCRKCFPKKEGGEGE